MRRAARGLAVALRTSYRADRWRTTGIMICGALTAAGVVLSAYWLKEIVDAAVARDEDAALAGAVGMGLTVGLGTLARTAVTAMLFPLKENTGAYLDGRLIELVSGTATIEHQERPAYLDQIDVLRHEAVVLAHAGLTIAGALGLSLQITVTGVLLASVNPLLLVVPLFAIPSFWASTRAEGIRQEALDASADAAREARHLFELGTGAGAGKEVRIFGLQEELVRRQGLAWSSADRRLDDAAWRGLAWSAVGWLLFTAGYAGAVGLAAAQAVEGRATVGEVVLALALVAQVNAQVGSAIYTVSNLARMVRVTDRYVWLEGYAADHRFTVEDPAPVPERLEWGIELQGVGFRYPDTDKEVLAGVDLMIPAGSVVALVGDNGAGKSTLVKLLCRFYEPSEGVILVDGTELSRMDPEAWRARMSAGFQDFAHLELLARQAVGVGDLVHVDDDEVVRGALGRAASAEVIEALPAGLETQLGSSFDEGVELSGGQWQKLALARAMMRPDPLLLVLDEPTAALDADTEFGLFARYTAAATAVAQRTGAITVLVSHRFSTVRMADLIIVVDGGRVAEVGSHRDLMDGSGLYAELYELQARAYR